jgi:hypothetical protein
MASPVPSTLELIDHVRSEFDRVYIGGVPALLSDDGAFLSFIAVLTGTEALAGFYAPELNNGDRFRKFVSTFFPIALRSRAPDLWDLRNAMVHSFHPGKFALTHHASRFHLSQTSGTTVLNAEDFYAALIEGSSSYFAALVASQPLQESFLARLRSPGGGSIQVVMGTGRLGA